LAKVRVSLGFGARDTVYYGAIHFAAGFGHWCWGKASSDCYPVCWHRDYWDGVGPHDGIMGCCLCHALGFSGLGLDDHVMIGTFCIMGVALEAGNG
jgi:hypothetical protein